MTTAAIVLSASVANASVPTDTSELRESVTADAIMGHLAELQAIADANGDTRASGFGPVQFAGEWLSDAWPGYMNGAVQTGRLAAEAVLAPAPAEAILSS